MAKPGRYLRVEAVAVLEALKARGWDDARIAQAVGVSWFTVGRWRRGQRPHRSHLKRLQMLLSEDTETSEG